MNYRIYRNGKEATGRRGPDPLREDAAGIFETMRAYGGRIFLLEEHLARLVESARTVGYRPLPDPGAMRREVEAALRSSGSSNVPA